MVTSTPFHLENIRASRKKPGLMRQHLTTIRAAVPICDGQVKGDPIGSKTLTFEPRSIQTGNHNCSVWRGQQHNTGAPDSVAGDSDCERSEPAHLGGRHAQSVCAAVRFSRAFICSAGQPHWTEDIGDAGAIWLLSHWRVGGSPVGIEPATNLQGIDIPERGKLRGRCARTTVTNLPHYIAERELNVVKRKLNWRDDRLHLEEVTNSQGPGDIVVIQLDSQHVTEIFTGFREVGRPA